ncbi:hypothetical protein RJ639_033099 [Escallonia herrerae]|uniref:Uncharacterized protein n=1 Tax=Escallonia herrerae TaxID=1293975 RepID=A0AA88WU80_9ASTE|nr:hypothetical protein RJ639_033099 [Escallonia herrerae]
MGYVYDGLYIVSNYWTATGPYGKLVFMFQLNKILGQLELAPSLASSSIKSKVHSERCMVDDISQGREKMHIRAMNAIDDEKPPPFNYITSMIYLKFDNLITPSGCNCIKGCSDSKPCFCLIKNGGEIPFNKNGAILEQKAMVYECGPSCKCPPSCENRVSQHGVRYQLEIFKTESRGWGVRSRKPISSGSFICEYAGELLDDKEAEERTGYDEYLFDIGKDNGSDNQDGDKLVDDNGFAIDAARFGNIGRFVNHSCLPNLYAQDVLYDHDDKRMPHVMLFAAEDIPPLQELTYDYNYTMGQVLDGNGDIKKKNCYCGASDCTGRMY